MSRVSDITKNLRKSKPIYEMANLRSHLTGLSNQSLVIYVSNRQGKHSARVKVYQQPNVKINSPCVVFSISKEPEVLETHNLKLSKKDLTEIKYWISINSVLLLKLWNSSIVYIDDYIFNFDKI